MHLSVRVDQNGLILRCREAASKDAQQAGKT